MGNVSEKSWKTPCGVLKVSSIIDLLKRLWKIIKAIISRCVFGLYCFIAIWRVTEALDNPNYWLLLLALSPLAVETLHAITSKQTNQFKWMTPNVLFFLLSAVPCIWLLEIKLLQDRLMEADETSDATGNNNADATTVSTTTTIQNIVNIDASDADWTLALEQLLIFALVLAKWISPKGGLSLDELSQLLLVNIAAGADIIELMETFNEEQVQQNSDIVFLIMTAWTWSLLQFALVLTASKDLPELSDDDAEEPVTSNQTQGENGSMPTNTNNNSSRDNDINKADKNHSETCNGNVTKDKPIQANGVAVVHQPKKESEVIEIEDETSTADKRKQHNKETNTFDIGAIHDNLRAEEEVDAFLRGRRCFDCFCCYNEIWGMAMSIFFQDGPFFILRMVILFHYGVITHMNIFFTGKNIFVIILLLNRIRVVYKEDRKKWLDHMDEVKKQRRKKKDKSRKKLGLPIKTKPKPLKKNKKPKLRKPRWLIWRS